MKAKLFALIALAAPLVGTNSHWFEFSIPARFSGIAGQFDTSRGRPGSYTGHLGRCRSIA